MTGIASDARRIVVSGMGIVSPFGAGLKTFWTGLSAGTCAIKPATLVETEGFRSRIAAEVPADVVAGLAASPRRSRADRLALAAASLALTDADLDRRERRAAALLVGAVGGGMNEGEEWYWEEARSGRPSPKIRALRSILPGYHAEALSSRLGVDGPKETLVMACASGAAALALGADLYARARRLTAPPLVEAAGCLWLERGRGRLALETRRGGERRRRHEEDGEMFWCGPMAALDRWRRGPASGPIDLSGVWRGEAARLVWSEDS